MICLSVVIEAPCYKMTAFASESEIKRHMYYLIAKKVNYIILIMKLFIGFDNMYIYVFLVCMYGFSISDTFTLQFTAH